MWWNINSANASQSHMQYHFCFMLASPTNYVVINFPQFEEVFPLSGISLLIVLSLVFQGINSYFITWNSTDLCHVGTAVNWYELYFFTLFKPSLGLENQHLWLAMDTNGHVSWLPVVHPTGIWTWSAVWNQQGAWLVILWQKQTCRWYHSLLSVCCAAVWLLSR